MISNIFNRSNASDELILELSTKVEGLQNKVEVQNNQITTQTELIDGAVKTLAVFRAYLESMESRIARGYEHHGNVIKDELSAQIEELKSAINPKEVVNQITKSSKENQIQRNLRAIKSLLNKAIVENCIDNLPLYSVNKTSKHPVLTPQGKALYGAWNKAVKNLAKVSGCNEEKFTHSKRFDEFFKSIGVKRYKRTSVVCDDKTIKTLWAAIIVNGHAKEYTQFLLSIVENSLAQ